jgi:hypothetical protein
MLESNVECVESQYEAVVSAAERSESLACVLGVSTEAMVLG